LRVLSVQRRQPCAPLRRGQSVAPGEAHLQRDRRPGRR
jgi:hypothetical protein